MTIISSFSEAAGKTRCMRRNAEDYVQVWPEAYAETDLKALWKNIAQKSEGRVKKRRFFHAPFVVASLFSAVFAGGYILGAADAFWGGGIILVC